MKSVYQKIHDDVWQFLFDKIDDTKRDDIINRSEFVRLKDVWNIVETQISNNIFRELKNIIDKDV